ncbi:MAG: SurA N-terminal domain-containing protein [Sphingobium sp.]|nr:SurA N-terminal domain-containing protein [Sphingobium sp.]
MISFLRRFIDSKVGIAIMLVFLGLIALAFAMGDITGQGGLGQIGGGGSGGTVAKVGGEKIGGNDLADRMLFANVSGRKAALTAQASAMLGIKPRPIGTYRLIAGARPSSALSSFDSEPRRQQACRDRCSEIAFLFRLPERRLSTVLTRTCSVNGQFARTSRLLRGDASSARWICSPARLGPPVISATLTDGAMVLPATLQLLLEQQRQGRCRTIASSWSQFAPAAAAGRR